MCLDIDPDSVIHKHLNQKISSLYENNGDGTDYNPVIGDNYKNEEDNWVHQSKHRLTMLPSFHISLGAPNPQFDHVGDSNTLSLHWLDIRIIIGEITLADIHISKKDGKKSAWIPLHPELIDDILPHHHNHRHYARPNDPNAFNNAMLHISLANLTGNPHDSIARPEDCVIDTIKN